MNTDLISPIALHIGLALLGASLYFAPTISACAEKKRNAVAIFALNLLLGWTLIGWVVAMVWSLCKDRD